MPYQVGVAGQQNLTHLVVVAHCVLCFETAIQTWNVQSSTSSSRHDNRNIGGASWLEEWFSAAASPSEGASSGAVISPDPVPSNAHRTYSRS
jgi:hypothetical protein